jgi:hypothetical protein
MNTFLPYPDISLSLRVLDTTRLGKQRLEAYQLIKGDRPSHPAARMWRNYTTCLTYYYNMSLIEWERRGFTNDILKTIHIPDNIVFPPWWGGYIHRTHQANLLAKAPDYYRQFRWDVPVGLEYFWPSGDKK